MRSRTSQLLSLILVIVLFVEMVAPVFAAPPGNPPAQGGGTTVAPSKIEATLAPGQSLTQQVSIRTAPIPIPKADVLFLFDVTSSMSAVLQSAKSNALYIMNTIRARVGDVAFGVASLCDYPGSYNYAGYNAKYGAPDDYPWRLDQDITLDTGAVQSAINRLKLMNGEDAPEDYSRALFEAILISWRPGAKKIVVLFADSYAHDVTFYGKNYGVDPGPDGIAGTGDDLVFTDVIAKVKAQKIVILPVNSNRGRNEAVARGFQYMADQTGGQMFYLDDAKQVAEVVTRGLVTTTSKIGKLEILPGAYAAWLTNVEPPVHFDVGGDETRRFTITLTVPRGTPPGTYTFNLTVSGDAATLGVIQVTLIVVTSPIMKFDIVKLGSEKSALISKMSSAPTIYHPVDVSGVIGLILDKWKLATYSEQERQVKSWVDGIVSKGDKARFEEGMALQRLLWQENALYQFYNAQARITGIIGEHAGNLVAVGFGTYYFLNGLKKVMGKLFRGALVTKIIKTVEDRLLSTTSHLVSMILSSAPKGSPLKRFDEIQKSVVNGMHIYLQNNKADKGKAATDLVAKGVIQWAFKGELLNEYTVKTQPLVIRGVERAQDLTASSADPTWVSERTRQIGAAITNTIDTINSNVNALEQSHEKIKAQQEGVKIVTDISDAFALLSASTGIGNTVSGLLKLLAILGRFIDGAMSVTVIKSASVQVDEIHSAAIQVTNEAFAKRDVEEVVDVRQVRESTPTASSEATIPMHMTIALADLMQRSDDYKSLLRNLAAALRAKDRVQLEALLEKLTDTDTALAQQAAIARAPIYSAASQLIRKPEFAESFAAMGRNSAHFDLADVAVYLNVIRALDNLDDATSIQAALDQIDQTIAALDKDTRSIQDLLPVVAPFAGQPYLVVVGYSAPAALALGQEFQLTVRLYNAGSTTATGAAVEIELPKNVKSLSSTRIAFADLAGGRDAQATFNLRWLQDNQAAIRVIPSTANGSALPTTIVVIGPDVTTDSHANARALLFLVVLLTIGSLGVAGALILSSSSGAGTLMVIRGQASRYQIPLTRGIIRLGRDRTNDLVFPSDLEVSRRHAEIRREPHGYVLYDLHSRNGTFVNERRISRHLLRNGDQIRIGKCVLVFQSA